MICLFFVYRILFAIVVIAKVYANTQLCQEISYSVFSVFYVITYFSIIHKSIKNDTNVTFIAKNIM